MGSQQLRHLTCEGLYSLFLITMKVGGCCVILAVLSSAVYGSYLTSVPKAPTPTKNCRTEYETVTSYEQQCTDSYEKECRKGKERKGKERKGKERKGKERKG